MAAIAGGFLVLLFIVITVIGLILLIPGIILDVRWIIKKRKKRDVKTVHKVFAIILTIFGVLMAIGPSASIGVLLARYEIMEQKEISDLSESDRVYVDDMHEVFSDGFDFHGKHYILAKDLKMTISHDNYNGNKTGAIILQNDNSHKLVYSVDNLAGVDILYIETYGGLYVNENEIDEVVDYYRNDAPLRAYISNLSSPRGIDVDDIDSERVRQIAGRIFQIGSDTNPNKEDISGKNKGTIAFFSTDSIYMFMLDYQQTSDGIVISMDGKYLLLSGEDAEYVSQLINILLEYQSSN